MNPHLSHSLPLCRLYGRRFLYFSFLLTSLYLILHLQIGSPNLVTIPLFLMGTILLHALQNAV
jgi:hypothetical protein